MVNLRPKLPQSVLALCFFVLIGLVHAAIEHASEEEQHPATAAEATDPELMEKRMFSYADLMNNFGGPSSLDFVAGNNYYMIPADEERPKREDETVELLTAWKRSPAFRGFINGNYLMKKDEFVTPGVLRFGKRMPGVLRFGKRNPQEKKAVPGVLRFGKRADVPGVLRFGKRMPQVLRFG